MVVDITRDTAHRSWQDALNVAVDHRFHCVTCEFVGDARCEEGARLEAAEKAAWSVFYAHRYPEVGR